MKCTKVPCAEIIFQCKDFCAYAVNVLEQNKSYPKLFQCKFSQIGLWASYSGSVLGLAIPRGVWTEARGLRSQISDITKAFILQEPLRNLKVCSLAEF